MEDSRVLSILFDDWDWNIEDDVDADRIRYFDIFTISQSLNEGSRHSSWIAILVENIDVHYTKIAKKSAYVTWYA